MKNYASLECVKGGEEVWVAGEEGELESGERRLLFPADLLTYFAVFVRLKDEDCFCKIFSSNLMPGRWEQSKDVCGVELFGL